MLSVNRLSAVSPSIFGPSAVRLSGVRLNVVGLNVVASESTEVLNFNDFV
jgi:hypothetical protein